MVTVLWLSILTALSCDFEGGFAKARVDIDGKAYGYNLDQFCFAAEDQLKTDYKKGYDEGRLHAPQLSSAGILENPKDESQLKSLLDTAEKKAVDAKQRAEIESLKAQLQKQSQTIDQLETDTTHLKTDTSIIKENLTQRSAEQAQDKKY